MDAACHLVEKEAQRCLCGAKMWVLNYCKTQNPVAAESLLPPLDKGWDSGKSLMSTSNQNPTKQHSMACLLQKRMSNLVCGPNRSPSSVPHHNQVSDWTSVRLDSAMLCWMLPVLSVTLEKKQKCLCGCQNEGFKPSAKTQNPLQLKACLPIGSTC